MTDQEIQALHDWQRQPEGCAYMAVRDLDNAITSLDELCMTREGTKFVRSEAQNIRASVTRLLDILANIQPVFVEAAE